MDLIWQWGLGIIHAVQAQGSPVLDAVFEAITFLGNEEFYLILLPLVLWCVDARVGVRLFLVFLPSAYLNTVLKDVFCHPRPFVVDPSVQRSAAEGYCTPSGHAQGAVVVWFTLASFWRRRWLWVLAALLSALIGFSRVYLGVHFPHSVLLGWATGAVIVALYSGLEGSVSAALSRASLGVQLALAVGVPMALLALHATPDTAVTMGSLTGAGVGLALAGRWARCATEGPWWQRAIRFLVGAAGGILAYLGLKVMFPDEGEPMYFALRTARYALVGLWGTLGAPWLFVRLRLAPRAESFSARSPATAARP